MPMDMRVEHAEAGFRLALHQGYFADSCLFEQRLHDSRRLAQPRRSLPIATYKDQLNEHFEVGPVELLDHRARDRNGGDAGLRRGKDNWLRRSVDAAQAAIRCLDAADGLTIDRHPRQR